MIWLSSSLYMQCSLISLDKRDDQPVNSCSGKKHKKMQIQWTDFSSFFNLSFSGSKFPFTCENHPGPASNSKEFRKGMYFWGPGGIPRWGREPGWRSAASLSCPCSSLLSQPCHLDRKMLVVRHCQYYSPPPSPLPPPSPPWAPPTPRSFAEWAAAWGDGEG